MRPLLQLIEGIVYWELSDLWGDDEHCYCHGGLAAGFLGRMEAQVGGYKVFPMLKKYRISGGCPINLQVGIHFDSFSRFFRLLPLSIVHPLSRCNISSPRDSRSHLVKDRGTSLVFVSSVIRKATMLGSVRKTSLPSLLSPQLTLA